MKSSLKVYPRFSSSVSFALKMSRACGQYPEICARANSASVKETPLALTVFVKCLAHWAGTGLPLVIASPLLSLFMNMNEVAIGAVMLTLLVGSPAITFIGAVGAAVAVALPRGGLLVSILVLPFTIPVLIFGVSATYAAVEDPAPFLPPFMILAALTLLFAALGPLAAAGALRQSSD